MRRYNATCFGYVGELCRYLLNQPERPDDRQHPLRMMVGNGLRPRSGKPSGIASVLNRYPSFTVPVRATSASAISNLDNTVGFSTAPFELVKFHEGTREPIRNEKGRLQRVAKGEPGLLLSKITPKWNFEGYSQKEATEKAILRNAFRKGDAWFNTGDVLRNIGCRHLQFVDRMEIPTAGKVKTSPQRKLKMRSTGSVEYRKPSFMGLRSPNQWQGWHGDAGPHRSRNPARR